MLPHYHVITVKLIKMHDVILACASFVVYFQDVQSIVLSFHVNLFHQNLLHFLSDDSK